MERNKDLPAVDQLIKGRLYKLHSRNLSFGIWNGETGFIGIRTKFGSKFLFTEIHWDADSNYGTVSHAVDTGFDLPENILAVEHGEIVDNKTRERVFYNKDKGGWSWEIDGEIDKDIWPCSVENKELFVWLNDICSNLLPLGDDDEL